jgi:hypothetical protein
MQRYRLFYYARIFTTSKYRLLSIFIFFGFLFLFIIYLIHSPVHRNTYVSDHSPSYIKPLSLLSKEKVLVPVGINRLYDYQVVCTNNEGIFNSANLINRLSNTCGVNLNGSINLNLNIPNDFQIRSPSNSVQLQKTTDTCSLYGNETIAIIIPYRDREKNLRNLLYNLIPLLNRQKIINYKIFITEQETEGAFNKGRLNNIAFHYLIKVYKPTCVIFHGKSI